LDPETADAYNIGFRFTPPALSGLAIEGNYFTIDYTNRIVSPPLTFDVFSHLDQYGSLISQLADDAAAQALVNSVIASGGRFLDARSGAGAAGLRYIYDIRQQNVGSQNVRGFDLSTDYGWKINAGNFSLRGSVTHISKFATAFGSGVTQVEQVNTVGSPLKWRGRLSATFARSDWSLNAAINHANAYRNTLTEVDEQVGAYRTFDMSTQYRFQGASEFASGVSLQVSAVNLFNKRPPYVSGVGFPLYPAGYDPANASPLGRFWSAELTKSW
jgi:hypothetical protein